MSVRLERMRFKMMITRDFYKLWGHERSDTGLLGGLSSSLSAARKGLLEGGLT